MKQKTFWTFVTNLRKVQSGHGRFYQELESGNRPPKKKKKLLMSTKEFLKL